MQDFFFKGRFNSERNTISQEKQDLGSQEGYNFSILTPSLKILTGPCHLEAADYTFFFFFLIQTGSRQSSEVSKMSVIEPHPNNTLR